MANTFIQKTLSALSEHLGLIQHRLDQLYHDAQSEEQAVDRWARKVRCFQTDLEENEVRVCHTRGVQMFTNNEIELIKIQLENEPRESSDGTLMWEISNIQEKICMSIKQRLLNYPMSHCRFSRREIRTAEIDLFAMLLLIS